MIKNIIFCIFLIDSVRSEVKSSLTFVIDDTGSMGDDIEAVKHGANAIFDTVMNSDVSQIEDFVLVTFNDPHISYRITTRDRDDFKRALSEIDVSGGGDCPEMAMTGIETALQQSRTGSLLYVFTDASAKDPEIYENLSLVELPYDYISVLNIDKVNSNNTYTCLANNDHGEDEKSIEVIVPKNNHFNVLRKPEDNIVELGSSAVFECKVDAYPPAEIRWYKHDTFELKTDESISISDNNSRLTIINMLPKHKGNYKCVAKNVDIEKSFDFNIRISGADVPVINKTITELYVREGSSVDISCKLIKGYKPTPKFVWYIRQRQYLKKIPVVGETFHINKFNSELVGSYVCKAVNEMGIDKHTVQLNMAYPPVISGPKMNNIIAKQAEMVVMPCSAEGYPKPDLKWLKDDVDLELTSKYTPSYYGNGISFIATEDDSGVYTCKAVNVYGIDSKTYNVSIVRPVIIEAPEDSLLILKIGDSLQLPCVADGFPEPSITWTLLSSDSKTPPQIVGHEPVLQLQRIQISEQGNYTCVASNIGGSVNITYEVKVMAPPMIENVYPEKTFYAVIDDVALRVPCKATGNPTPEISWIKDGVDKVAAGTEWYDQEEDGTLVIKNVDKLSAGTYVCQAENLLGFDNETYEVIVEAYPRLGSPTKSVLVEEGKSATLICDVPHIMKTDYVRWYKDGLLLSKSAEHHLLNARVSDAGIYTCRVSNFAKSRSGNVRVNVGVPPRFSNDEELNINYEKDVAAIMDCTAEGTSLPEISWWHEGRNLEVHDMTYIIDNMTPKDKGKYFCVVKNEFGQIVREFNIISQECSINIETELSKNQPLILTNRPSYLTRSFTWTQLESDEGHMIIPPGEYLRLQCPSGFENFPSTEIIASCERETNFTVEGTSHKFSELKCRDEIQPTVTRTGNVCLPTNKNTEYVKVGYDTARGNFLEVFEICIDMAKSTSIFAKHTIHGTMARVDPKDSTIHLVDNSILPITFDNNQMYDCNQQNVFTSYILGKSFHNEDGCCFRSRSLVNPKDVAPGLPQKATYSSLNMVPQWSSCNSQNWDQVERRIRHLARSTSDNLQVWTGVSQQLQIADRDINLRSRENYYPVPKYFWKVVQDPSTKASLAIIQLNIPDTTLTDAYRNMPCRDICNEVIWMRSRHWRNVKRGYTFCCRIQDFERAFGYEGIFNGSGKVLYDVSFVAERAMTS